MVESWIKALKNYSYSVNLAEFNKKEQNPGFFNRQITPLNLKQFENDFSDVIKNKLFEKYAIIGEVMFWKLDSYKEDRHVKSKTILDLVKDQNNFENFCITLRNLADNPSKDNFIQFRQSCGQKIGFAVPVTFLSFFRSSQYPMVDLYVSKWWNPKKLDFGYGESPKFIPDGPIKGDELHLDNNWTAYLHWTNFCLKYADILSRKTKNEWRARDVEMAIFSVQQSQNNRCTLNPLNDDEQK